MRAVEDILDTLLAMSELSDSVDLQNMIKNSGRYCSGQNEFGNHGCGFLGRLILPRNEAVQMRTMQWHRN
jgi:hypothetical protein